MIAGLLNIQKEELKDYTLISLSTRMFLTVFYCGQSLGPLCANTAIWLNKYIIYYLNGDIFDNEMGLFFLIMP